MLAAKEDFAVKDADGADLFPIAQAVDHPFHIHQNPFWVTERWLVTEVDNASEKGEIKLVRDPNWIPRWQDVIHIPRIGGRTVFRSRFWDFLGLYVNHCHLLLHEDNGMMQPVKVIEEARPIAVETIRGEIVYKQQPDGSGIIESINGKLANYAIVPQKSLTDSDPGLTEWTSEADSIWPPAATRQDCFLQSQTALDTSMLPVDPVCGQGKLPPPRSQGLGFVEDFCEPSPPVPTPSSSGE